MTEIIKSFLDQNWLLEYEETIEGFSQAAVGLSYGEIDSEAAIDASKAGGNPALPSVEDWPRKGDGQPLDFLVQINFAEVALVAKLPNFPEDGLGLFFYDVVEQLGLCGPLLPDGFKVLYYPAKTPLVSGPSLSEDRPARGYPRIHKVG